MTNQLSLDDAHAYLPKQPRDTQTEAAELVLPKTGTQRRMVYEFIQSKGNYGATDEEIKAQLDINPNSEIPRRLELEEQGFIGDSGERRLTQSGSEAIVWKVKSVLEVSGVSTSVRVPQPRKKRKSVSGESTASSIPHCETCNCKELN